MREIKFRQPIISVDNKFLAWHYWGFLDGVFQGIYCYLPSYQYTGLKDKNGKEIYEGDIVIGFPTGNQPALVDFAPGAFMVYWKSENEWLWLYQPPYEWKVIGNINENPELLEVKNGS